MNKIYICIVSAVALIFFNTSCLDVDPDNRAELNNELKLKKLLVSAYPNNTNILLFEYMSDNVDRYLGNFSASRHDEAVYEWKDTPESANDASARVWESSYLSIASANHVLAEIEEWESQGNKNLKAIKGEALLTRAYNHFVLVNTFCMHFGKNSNSDLGVPYADKVETTVAPKYERGTVAQTYARIMEDIEAGIPLIDDNIYEVPKYHFNIKACYAFAVRFYLYYEKFDKAIEYANKLFKDNPTSQLRDWAYAASLDLNTVEAFNEFVAIKNKATLMNNTPTSNWGVRSGPYASGTKISHGAILSKNETAESTGAWGSASNLNYNVWTRPDMNKVTVFKVGNYEEVVDPIAQTVLAHIIHPVFTTDEVLLNRAEAYAIKGELNKAMEDLTTFMKKFSKTSPPTLNDIKAFYGGLSYYEPNATTVRRKLDPDFLEITENSDQELLLQYILHLRRVVTIHEGLRWPDIKRYGITIYRRDINRMGQVETVSDKMEKGDKRQAIQLPQEVTSAGLAANPR